MAGLSFVNFEFEDVIIAIPDEDYTPGELYGSAKKELDARNTFT